MLKTSGEAPGVHGSQSPRVLVVDDDKAIRTLVTTVLTRNGDSVETAQNGEEAIGAIAGKKFGAIVLDLMMPKLDGFEVIEHLARTSTGATQTQRHRSDRRSEQGSQQAGRSSYLPRHPKTLRSERTRFGSDRMHR
jgi:CheY-like chemotaxis protein